MKRPKPPAIAWQDLRHLTAWQVAYNVILPYPFLALSWWGAFHVYVSVAIVGAYFFYVTAFRQTHDSFHGSLGVGGQASNVIQFVMSGLLLSSTHAMKASHLAHHRDPLADDDAEGSLARLGWWQAIFSGISFRIGIHRRGYQVSHARNRRAIWVDFMIILGVVSVAVWAKMALDVGFLLFHVVVITLANILVGFVGVWGLHHGIDEGEVATGVLARTERNRLANVLTFNLLYHAEHHLFPAVPSNHLPELAKRIDEVAPHLTGKKVLPFLQSPSKNETCPIRKRLA